MFDAVRNNKKIVRAFLVVITLPFAFWGVESYMRNAEDGDDVATVGDSKISRQELRAAINEQHERLRAQFGASIDPSVFDTSQMRGLVLDSLVKRRLMAQQVQNNRLVATDDLLAQVIASIPEFQEGGNFSATRYETAVAAQGMSKEMFEARMRQQLVMQQLLLPVSGATIAGETSASNWMSSQLEQREVAESRLLPDAYLSQVKLADEAAKKYYDSNHSLFELPELVRAEYVVLNAAALQSQLVVSDADIKAHYESHVDRYKESETRHARHILITLPKGASEAEEKVARSKAAEVLAQVKSAPDDFSRLAKTYSQDPGSAEKGGDLGWFGRGMMVKPFEEAVFSLKAGGISDLVRSDFGFHIIQLVDIRAEHVKSYDAMKAELADELRRESGVKKYAEAAESFGNTVYEQADSLVPAAEKWKLEKQQTGWLAKGSKLPPPFDNPKLAGALFSDDAIKNKRNTEAVEVMSGTLVAARVLEHKPAELQPFAAVKAPIEKRLLREEALKLAVKNGEDTQVRLAKGETVTQAWSASRSVSRAAPQGLTPDALRAIFKANTTKLPAYVGLAVPESGYVLYRITAVNKGKADKADLHVAELAQRYSRAIAEEEFSAWLDVAKEKTPVTIVKGAVENKDR
ncbi:MAG: SurA N-terminal domain-containing protein [Rugosibacter sp.]|nr:SurA N-terminal domain-containing protein [Rugosibacter sp.]